MEKQPPRVKLTLNLTVKNKRFVCVFSRKMHFLRYQVQKVIAQFYQLQLRLTTLVTYQQLSFLNMNQV